MVEHCSANAEATGSNPVKSPEKLFFFFGLLCNCLNCDSTAMVTYSFPLNYFKKAAIMKNLQSQPKIVHFIYSDWSCRTVLAMESALFFFFFFLKKLMYWHNSKVSRQQCFDAASW